MWSGLWSATLHRRDRQGRIDGRTYLVYAHAPHALQRAVRGERGRGVLTVVDRARLAVGIGEQPAQEGLARRPDQHREAERDETRQRAQQRPVVLGGLGEAEA